MLEVDTTLPRTLRTLLLQPGRLTREYREGRWARQLAPTRLYLASAAIYFFVAPRLGDGVIRWSSGGGFFVFGPLTWDTELLLLLLVPLWAAVVRLVLAGRVRYFEEAFVFSVHYNVVFFGWMLVLAGGVAAFAALGLKVAAVATVVVGLFVPLPYLMRAMDDAFDVPPARRAFSAVVLFLVHVGLGQGIFNLFTSLRR